jgi:hypothetical protein
MSCDQDVGWFHISVHDAHAVCRIQCRRNLTDPASSLIVVNAIRGPDPVGKRRPRDVFHDYIRHAVVDYEIVHANRIRMRQPGSKPGLSHHSIQTSAIVAAGSGKKLLDRDLPVQQLIFCEPHLTHRAPPERAQTTIATSQHGLGAH